MQKDYGVKIDHEFMVCPDLTEREKILLSFIRRDEPVAKKELNGFWQAIGWSRPNFYYVLSNLRDKGLVRRFFYGKLAYYCYFQDAPIMRRKLEDHLGAEVIEDPDIPRQAQIYIDSDNQKFDSNDVEPGVKIAQSFKKKRKLIRKLLETIDEIEIKQELEFWLQKTEDFEVISTSLEKAYENSFLLYYNIILIIIDYIAIKNNSNNSYNNNTSINNNRVLSNSSEDETAQGEIESPPQQEPPKKRKPGRPKGSRNKKKKKDEIDRSDPMSQSHIKNGKGAPIGKPKKEAKKADKRMKEKQKRLNHPYYKDYQFAEELYQQGQISKESLDKASRKWRLYDFFMDAKQTADEYKAKEIVNHLADTIYRLSDGHCNLSKQWRMGQLNCAKRLAKEYPDFPLFLWKEGIDYLADQEFWKSRLKTLKQVERNMQQWVVNLLDIKGKDNLKLVPLEEMRAKNRPPAPIPLEEAFPSEEG